MNTHETKNDLKQTRKTHKRDLDLLNQRLKSQNSALRGQAEPEARKKTQVEIDLITEEVNKQREAIADINEQLAPLEELELGEDGKLPPASRIYLEKLGFDKEVITMIFTSEYIDFRKKYPHRKLPSLKSLSLPVEILSALAAIDGETFWIDEDETWDELYERYKQLGMDKETMAAIKNHCLNMCGKSHFGPGRSVGAMLNISAAKNIIDDIPKLITALNVPVVIAHAKHILFSPEAERQTYVEFEKAYWEAENAYHAGQSPYLVRCLSEAGDEPGAKQPDTVYWFEGIPSRDALAAWNEVIKRTVPGLTASSPVFTLGDAPFGCKKDAQTHFNPGHDKFMRVLRATLQFLPLFVLNAKLADTSKDDQVSHYGFQQVLVWIGGLGLDAIRMFCQQIAAEDADGADFYANASDQALTQILLNIATQNKSPASGFGVLRPDFSDYLPCVVQTGLVPRWLTANLLMTLFKYGSIEIDHSEKAEQAVMVIEYKDSKLVIPIAKGFFHQPLSEGKDKSGNGPLRDALIKHLNLMSTFPSGMEAVKTQIENMLKSIFKKVRPADFPIRDRLSSNPFIIAPPTLVCQIGLNRDDFQRYFNVTRRYQIYRFNPSGGILQDDRSTPEETILYAWSRRPYNAVENTIFKQSLPDRIVPLKFSESIRPYVKSFDQLGHLKGMLQSLDILIGVDLVKQLFPDAPVVYLAANRETPLTYFIPSDGSDPDRMTNQGKTRAALAIGGTSNLHLVSTPSKSDNSAPAQRTIVVAFYQCDHTFFADDLREITNPGHMLHENNLRTIATEGRGASAGLAKENANVLIFRHPVFFTMKYVPQQMPDTVNRSFIYYLTELTPDNRLSSEDYAYFSSLKFRLTARLNFLAWMFTSGFSQLIYEVKPRVGSLRYEGHNGIAGALLGDGTTLEADLTEFNAYMTEAQGAKCKAQYAQAIDSGVVEYASGQTIIDPVAYFQAASALTISAIASMIDEAVGLGSMQLWKLITTDAVAAEYSRVASAEGFTKIGIKKLGGQLFNAAKAGLLIRNDGWQGVVIQITLPSGSRAPHILLFNNNLPEHSMKKWDATLSFWAKKHTKKEVKS